MSGAIAGLVIAGATTAVSFTQASRQRDLQEDAIKAADEAMLAAQDSLNVNFAEQQSINKEAYDAERLAMLSQGAQLTNAGIESERGSAATAGRVYAGQQAGQQAVRGAMSDEMTNIESSILEEDARLRDLNVSLDLEEVAGNQLRASEARSAADLATQQGIQGAASVVGQAASMPALYSKNMAQQQTALGGLQLSEGDNEKFNNAGQGNGVSFNRKQIGQMSGKQFRQYQRSLTPQQKGILFNNPSYTKMYSGGDLGGGFNNNTNLQRIDPICLRLKLTPLP